MKALWLGMAAALMASSAHAALTISTAATSNVTCSAGVCSATAKKAVLSVSDLTNMLAAGSVTVESGDQANDIAVAAPFSWTSSNALTLDADNSITVNKAVADSGPAALTLTYGKKGDLRFGQKGNISFTSTTNSLTINKTAYTLVDSIASLARDIAKNPPGFYAMSRNYDAGQDGTYARAPIATITGKFNGLGNTISNLAIDSRKSEEMVGLFSTIAIGGSVSSLNIHNVNISASQQGAAGAIAGFSYGLIFNDSADGAIAGTDKTASLGGIVGATNQGSIVDLSLASVNISGGEYADAGGLVGAGFVTISRSYASGTISADNRKTNAGGLIGANLGTIENCYSLGDVMGGTSGTTGGFVGDNANTPSATITSSYSIGKVTSQTNHAGGFAGYNGAGTLQKAYWDITTSGSDIGVGQGHASGVKGVTDEQLKSGLPKGFDPSVWAEDPKINSGYPYLIDNPPQK